jgi:hypothetical protein
MNIYKTLGNHEPRIPPPPISTPRQTDTLETQRPIAYRSTQPPKWSGSKKSWMRSSCANKTALMTKTTGTQILVHISPTTPRNPQHFITARPKKPHPLTHNAESDTSSIASAPVDETLYERILALQDMIPASTRRSVSSKISTTTSWLKSGLFMGGKTLWVVSTSALLLGVPWALAYSEEQMIVEQERAEIMAQRAQNEVCFAR